MPLSYPYKKNEEDEEIPILKIVDETMTPFEQLPVEKDYDKKNSGNGFTESADNEQP